ncbi:wax ester/triacylglycerol synthase family O-acyltransferase [Marinobacter sp. CA1]|uniref:wax ester/triacylglycerol synthase family O-acyltransferase n=1 Tax=Marinobacter sp. CA1 TaxID=2817656 RepID=UPI001D080ACB|nr:wax ester/triacylglycerol synthase family O-acyltransferase [Marinobacter sp. CA1]UDL05743.1 wax ester/triacylglycerol synthase family O-acyltransferase [Marinobacter sp. CA1]
MQPHSEPMSAVDRAWLRMESEQNPMMISAVLAFDDAIPLPRLRRVLSERLLAFRRFRQRPYHHRGTTYWQDDPRFDLDNHLHRMALAGQGSQLDLQELVSDLNSTPLDFRHPLWQIHYVDHYGDGCALIVRIHHCIADGLSLVRVLLSLTDSNATPKVHTLSPSAHQPPRRQSRWQRRLDQLLTAPSAVRRNGERLRHSLREGQFGRRFAREASGWVVDGLKLALAANEPPTGLKPALSGRKQVAWANPLDLAQVKACAHTLGGTVNDVLLSIAAGTLHQYFENTGRQAPDCGLRVAVPFNLRPLHQPVDTLGNQFGLVLVTLPVDVPCPLMRFHQTRETMSRLKQSHQAEITYSLLDLFGHGPDQLERQALNLLSHKATAVLTNVPGPKQPVYLAGARLRQPMFWVPQSGDIGIGMSIFTYDGTVQFGFSVDKAIDLDPNAVMTDFHNEFERLLQATPRGQPFLGEPRAAS